MKYHVTIWLNVQRDSSGHAPGFLGYRSSHEMEPVFTYAMAVKDDINPNLQEYRLTPQEALCEMAFQAFNAPEEFLSGRNLSLARRYRANRLRSLSVGDVIQVSIGTTHQYFAVLPLGYAEITNILVTGRDNHDAFSDEADARYRAMQAFYEEQQ